MIENISKLLNQRNIFDETVDSIKTKSTLITGVSGSLTAFLLLEISKNVSNKIVFINSDTSELEKVMSDLEVLSDKLNLAMPFFKGEHGDDNTKALNLFSGNESYVVFAEPDSLEQNVVNKRLFESTILKLKTGDEYDFETLISKLEEYNYSKNDFVEEQGEYSVRGGIVDVFSDSLEVPVRIEFFGDTIESIREFDLDTQRSLKVIDSVSFAMNLSREQIDEAIQESYDPLYSYIPDDTLFLIQNPENIDANDAGFLKVRIANRRTLFISSFNSSAPSISSGLIPVDVNVTTIDALLQPEFYGNLKQLYSDIQTKVKNGFEIYILCSDKYQSERIVKLLDDFEDDEVFRMDDIIHHKSSSESKLQVSIKGKYHVYPQSLHSGFVLDEFGIAVYTEHQIFGRFFRQTRKKKLKFKGLTFAELKELRPGDYVVHRDFGVGIYYGLKKIKAGNNEQEAMLITYDGNDKVYVNLNYIHLVKKYSSTEGHVPKLTRLGGGEWDKIKQRAKKKVKDIARDLILLYAKRKSSDGFKFSEDTHWQRELEASFMYEDTPDQIRSTGEIKIDMETPHPMDRLVCGDVGFGKTEVAVRAAFKAVMDNKQVAILVPTTILAKQHYNTFRDRLSPFAVEVGVISRLEKKSQQMEILENVKAGKINILIGTHRILSKDVEFKDLGLLIIDEEQRFGVKAKETLRALKPNIDTLTLTATPIPRTLNFSLLGARDLSIINTPPKNRKPIKTELINLNWDEIGRIIKEEINRGGQVYFVNDKINKMYSLAEYIRDFVPSAKIGIAHGQMDARELEDVVIDFIEKKLNVLVCTKIIESGLDIPNVNTIIINEAQNFGLAELYQLRGRVGRSDQQAFAYLISPKSKMTRTAVRRLLAIEEFTELGSGINLAMRDMEIRGVGNLLGQQQSGFVQQMGFDLFMNIIDEAVEELKTNEFSELFKDEKFIKEKLSGDKIEIKTREPAIIENDLNALLPEDYIQSPTERLNIYKRLYEAKSIEEVNSISLELNDRFGEYLEDVENLLELVKLRISATDAGLEKILISGDQAFIFFPEDKESEVYKSSFFERIIEFVSKDKSGNLKIENDRKRLVISASLPESDKEKITDLMQLLIE